MAADRLMPADGDVGPGGEFGGTATVGGHAVVTFHDAAWAAVRGARGLGDDFLAGPGALRYVAGGARAETPRPRPPVPRPDLTPVAGSVCIS